MVFTIDEFGKLLNPPNSIVVVFFSLAGIGAIQKMNLTATTNKDHIAHPLHPVADLVSWGHMK